MVRTELVDNLTFTEEELQKDMARYPLGRYGESTDIANAVVFPLVRCIFVDIRH